MKEQFTKRDKAMMLIGARWMIDKFNEVESMDSDEIDDFIISCLPEQIETVTSQESKSNQ